MKTLKKIQFIALACSLYFVGGVVVQADEHEGFKLSPENSNLTFYGSLRPAVTYSTAQFDDPYNFSYEIDADPNSSIEVTDFFTRIGIKGDVDVGYGINAFARVETQIAIDQNGEFDPRLAFAGVEGVYGRVAIGRQTHPHYNIVAEVTDVYNHRSSPFGYDTLSPFRRPGLVTYSNSLDTDLGTFKLDGGAQFSRQDAGGPGAGGNDDRPGIDSGSIGASYKNDLFYLGLSYLERKRDNGASRDFYSVGASINPMENVYLAATAQKIEQGTSGQDKAHTIDVVATYAFPGNCGCKLILGYFDVDVPEQNFAYTGGYNVTLQRQVSDNFRVFIEWLRFNYDNKAANEEDNADAISIGFRYDFSFDVF